MTAGVASGRRSRDQRRYLAWRALEAAGFVLERDPAGFWRIRR